jgi:hypothetical protein
MRLALVVLLGCGSARTTEPVSSPAPAEPASTAPAAPTAAAPIGAEPTAPAPASTVTAPASTVAAPARREVRVSIEHVITAGPRPTHEIEERLASARAALADCGATLDASVALELQLAITAEGQIPHVSAFRENGDVVGCVAGALGSLEQEVASDAEHTDVYAVVTLDVAGMADAARPSPPSLKDDIEAACSMFKRSGATSAPVADRQKIAKAWYGENVRHPAVHHHFAMVRDVHPADVQRYIKSIRKKAKGVRCEDPNW